jgi:hypothetical protein
VWRISLPATGRSIIQQIIPDADWDTCMTCGEDILPDKLTKAIESAIKPV